MLGTDSWVVETGGDGVCTGNLPFRGLEDVGSDSVEYSFRAEGEGGGVVGGVES